MGMLHSTPFLAVLTSTILVSTLAACGSDSDSGSGGKTGTGATGNGGTTSGGSGGTGGTTNGGSGGTTNGGSGGASGGGGVAGSGGTAGASGGGGGGNSAGVVKCGTDQCESAQGEICCSTNPGDIACHVATTCTQGNQMECDGPNDCASAAVCCGSFGDITRKSSCEASCPLGSNVMCATNTDCPTGTTCCPDLLAPEYSTCSAQCP